MKMIIILMVMVLMATVVKAVDITNCTALQEINDDLEGVFILTNEINCTNTSTWNSGAGFVPIGNSTHTFNGSIDGNNYSVNNLFINRTVERYQGLIGYGKNASVSNLGVLDANVTGNLTAGVLAAEFDGGNISNCWTSGELIVLERGNDGVGGGLLGYFYTQVGPNPEVALINASHSNVTILGGRVVGGLVGAIFSDTSDSNQVLIENSYYTGSITGSTFIGGLVGYAQTGKGNITIRNSYSNATLFNTSNLPSMGGILGSPTDTQSGEINVSDCFAVGNISSIETPNTGAVIGGETIIAGTLRLNNLYWYNQPDGVTKCNENGNTSCTSKTELSYFQGDIYPDNEPTPQWEFFDIWKEQVDDFPVLVWQGLGGNVLTTSQNTGGSSGIPTQTSPNSTNESCERKIKILDRLLDDCRVENGVCDDGEFILFNEDCNLKGSWYKDLWFGKILIASLGYITLTKRRIRNKGKLAIGLAALLLLNFMI